MSKQRYIKDSFWTDPYIEKLSPDFKLVFLYLLTNPLANVAGVYELRVKRIAYETGYDIEVIENVLARFEKDKKIVRIRDWIIIVNHMKHQNLSQDTATGINRTIRESPQEVQSLFSEETVVNSKGSNISVLIIKSKDIEKEGGLQAPSAGTYSVVKLSRVKLSKVGEGAYGEFEKVKLGEEEYKKLVDKFGEQNTKILIEELDNYIASTGKKYSSHYATLLNWARRKFTEHQQKVEKEAKKAPTFW